MMNALYSATSALNASASVGAVTANNIANLNTQGFKSRMATLADMSRGGVKFSSVRLNDAFGPAIPTGNPRDVAIFSKSDSYDKLAPYYSSTYERFSVDNLGNFRAPSGDILFTGAGGSVRMDADGNLFKNGELIGQFTAAGDMPPLMSGEALLEGYTVGSNTNILTETVNNLVNQRFFEANLVTARTANDMMGTLMDIMS